MKTILRSLLIALVLGVAPLAFAGAGDQCMDAFDGSPVVDENSVVFRTKLDKLEDDAVVALRQMQLTTEEAKANVSSWLRTIETKIRSGHHTTVMEHTALVHIARSDFLADELPDENLERNLRDLVELSWQSQTGSRLSYDQVIETSLPRSALRGATYREVEFQKAVFRSPMKAAGGEAPAPGRPIPTVRQVIGGLTLLAIGFSHGGGTHAGEVVAGAITGYTISAMAEWITHRYLLHPSKKMVDILKRIGGDRATMAFRFHTGHHHGMFTTKKYSTEMNAEWNEADLIDGGPKRIVERRDAIARKAGDNVQHLHDNQYGMSMNRKEIITASVSTMSVATLMSFMFGFGAEGYAAALATAPMTAILTASMHPDLHKPVTRSEKDANSFVRWIFSTAYWKSVSQLHYVHHFDPANSNFSLFLPGPDFFMKTLRKPDLPMLVRMDELGLAY